MGSPSTLPSPRWQQRDIISNANLSGNRPLLVSDRTEWTVDEIGAMEKSQAGLNCSQTLWIEIKKQTTTMAF